MKKFCEELYSILQSKKDPFDIAAFILHQLISIHPFANANRRTARTIMNSFLLALDIQPILIPVDSKAKYYHLIETLDVSELSVLAELLRHFSKMQPKQSSLLTQPGKDVIMIAGLTDIGVFAMLADEKYEIFPMSQFAEYHAQWTSGEKNEKLTINKIDGDTCYFKAKELEKSCPLIASYLFYRSARFYEVEKKPSKSIQARRLAEKLTPQLEIEFKDAKATDDTGYLAALIKFKDDDGGSVNQILDKLIAENKSLDKLIAKDQPSNFLDRLAFVCGEDIVRFPKDEKGKVAFPLFWLRNLNKDARGELVKKLKIDERKLNLNR